MHHLSTWLPEKRHKVLLIWDGASYHEAKKVKATCKQLGFALLPLPGYSPDLNPIEGLWKWLREDVTQLQCHDSLQALWEDCLAFIDRINLTPEQIITRLWPHFELNPDAEKLRLSS